MNKDIRMILGALDLLHTACEEISSLNGCERCPIRGDCLEECDVLDLAEELSVGELEEFLAFSDDIQDYKSEQDWEALYADEARKMEIEERMIEEEWGI